jgi:hypothetical protein
MNSMFCETNPDVQELVKTGVYGSALEWYLETNPSDLETFAKHAKVVGSESDDVIHLREGNETALAGDGNDVKFMSTMVKTRLRQATAQTSLSFLALQAQKIIIQ